MNEFAGVVVLSEKHRDLVVRVAGFSARFIELSLLEQEEILRRADCAEGNGV